MSAPPAAPARADAGARAIPAGWLLLSFPLLWVGGGRSHPFAWLGDGGVSCGRWLWFAVTLVWLFGLCLPQATGPFAEERLRRLGARLIPWLAAASLLLIPCLDLLSWGWFAVLGYPFPHLLLLVGLAALAAFLVFRGPLCAQPTRLLLFAAAVSVLHLAVATVQFPLPVQRSDMLPVNLEAARRFAAGAPAYLAQVEAVFRVPYLPLMWLSFLPAASLALDPRWCVVAFRLLLVAALLREARHASDFARGYWALWFLNPYLAFRHDLYLDAFWLLLFLGFAEAKRGRLLPAAIWAGMLMATLQWGWLCAPFIVLAAAPPRAFRRLLAAAALACAVPAAVFAFFHWREGPLFWQAISQHVRLTGSPALYAELCLGLSGPFIQLGWFGFLQAAQVCLLLAGGGWGLATWWRGPNATGDGPTDRRERILAIGLATVLAFTLLNPLVENYFFLGLFLLAGLLMREAPPPATGDAARAECRFRSHSA
jgi:hypothetical protein